MPVSERPASLRRPIRRQWSFRRLEGDWLEQRTLLATSPLKSAVALQFGPFNDAQVSHNLSIPNEFDLYSVTLEKGETVSAAISAQEAGSALTSLLRVFDSSGTPLALDNQQGGDPRLNFQASTAGTYYIGVSSIPITTTIPTFLLVARPARPPDCIRSTSHSQRQRPSCLT